MTYWKEAKLLLWNAGVIVSLLFGIVLERSIEIKLSGVFDISMEFIITFLPMIVYFLITMLYDYLKSRRIKNG